LDRSFFRFVTMHAFNRRTDRQTDRILKACSAVKTVLVKIFCKTP